jgi:hypothetical protein
MQKEVGTIRNELRTIRGTVATCFALPQGASRQSGAAERLGRGRGARWGGSGESTNTPRIGY